MYLLGYLYNMFKTDPYLVVTDSHIITQNHILSQAQLRHICYDSILFYMFS